jgi:hypothetical protein
MSPVLKSVASVAVLVLTAFLLLADAAPPPCNHPEQSVTFTVSGNTCGPNGTLTLVSPQDACGIEARGASAVGLPEFASFNERGEATYELKQGGWRIHGHRPEVADAGMPDGGAVLIVPSRECEATGNGSTLKLSCTDRNESFGAPVGTCEATLTPQ